MLVLQILSISGFNVKHLASLHRRSSFKKLHYFVGFSFPLEKGVSSIFTGHFTFKVSTEIQVSHKSPSTEDVSERRTKTDLTNFIPAEQLT